MIELAEDNEPQDNCYSAADMADQAAKAFRDGYNMALRDVTNHMMKLLQTNND